MERTKWVERKFNFDFPAGWLPNIMERLHGTTPRIEEITSLLSDDELLVKPNGKWSIKEHIGHLSDLEELHEGRIDDLISRKTILRSADMDNKKTIQADHNKKNIRQLLEDFNNKRNSFITSLKKLDDLTQNFQSLHPRLQVLMRPIDVACFAAEHDDHHLATMREILNSLK